MALKIAFLDVDHTLTRHATGYRVAMEALERRILGIGDLLSIPLFALWYRFGPVGADLVLPSVFPALKGLSEAELGMLGEESFRKRIRGDLYPEASELVRRLRSEGFLPYLSTSSFDFIVAPLARELGIEGCAANRLEMAGGMSTGRIEGGMHFGMAKLERCEALVARMGGNLADCAFYSDSIHDAPLLMAVGRPVAVNPDHRLKRLARERGWEMLRFKGRHTE